MLHTLETHASTENFLSVDFKRSQADALFVAPAHVAAFADAHYENTNIISLQEGANVVLVDALAAGRIEPAAERWQFTRAASSTEIICDNRLIYRDGYDLRQVPGLPTPLQLMAQINFKQRC